MESMVYIPLREYEETTEELNFLKEKVEKYRSLCTDKKTVKIIIDYGNGSESDLEILNFKKNLSKNEIEHILYDKFMDFKKVVKENYRLHELIKNYRNRSLLERIKNKKL